MVLGKVVTYVVNIFDEYFPPEKRVSAIWSNDDPSLERLVAHHEPEAVGKLEKWQKNIGYHNFSGLIK
ncbi:MAG: hypothetical protein V1888_02785 [archaeon]